MTESVTTSPMFGVVAPAAGWIPPLRFLLRRNRVLPLLRTMPPGRLVEIGCGAGALLVDFAAMGHECTGVETSGRALAVARVLCEAAGGGARVVEAPLDEWRGRLDAVCSFDVLEHIEDDREALATWVDWLRPGGVAVLSVPAHRSRWGAGDEWAGHFRRYDRADFERLLRGANLRIEHLECYGFPLANLTEWAGQRVYRRRLAQRAAGFSRQQATAGSGIEMRDADGLFRRVDTVPGRLALQACFLMQALFSRTDLGSGFLAVARKP